MKNKNNPDFRHEFDVSIVVLSFNHGTSIVAALTSVFAQETDMRVELLISDDASTDQTMDRIIGLVPLLETKFSTVVMDHNVNTGAAANFVNTIKSAKGRFIAYLEGDDYWIDTGHVQKMFDACLGSQQLAGVTSGHMKIRVSDGETIDICSCRETNSFQTLANLEFYPLLGASMWKRDIIFSVPDELLPYLTDTMLWHFIAKQGQCVALPHISLCYNITGVGVHTSLSFFHVLESHVELYMRLHQYEKSSQTVDQLKFWLWWAIENCGDRGDYVLLKKYSKQLVSVCQCFQPVDMKIILKYKLLSRFPFLLSTYKKLHSRL